MNVMYEYPVCNCPDKELYNKCREMLDKIDGMVFVRQLIDVDETLIAIYDYHGSKVKVVNDEYIPSLYIESETDIEHLIYKKESTAPSMA